jgi:NADPH:quinone reductase-like Zn-dependent oxidoreductase
MTSGGIYVAAGVRPGGRWIGPLPHLLKVLVTSPFVSQKVVVMMASIKPADLAFLAELIEVGKVKPVIDRRYPLDEVREAIRYLAEGHARGKVIITVDSAATPLPAW